MKKSPEADKVIISYKQDQYPAAIDYMARLGRMNTKLEEAMRERDKAERLRLEASVRDEKLRIEIDALKRGRMEYEKNINIKMSELQKNIEKLKKPNDEIKRRFTEEEKNIIKDLNLKFEELHKKIEEIEPFIKGENRKKSKCVIS